MRVSSFDNKCFTNQQYKSNFLGIKLNLCNWVYSGVFLVWPPPHILMFSAKRDLMTLLKAVLTNKLNQKIFDDCVESNVNKQTERRSSVIFLFQTICFATTICYTNSHLFCNNKACHFNFKHFKILGQLYNLSQKICSWKVSVVVSKHLFNRNSYHRSH